MLTIVPLERAHAADAARLHILGQPGTFLTRLGPGVLRVLYATLPATPSGFGFAAAAAGAGRSALAGFVAATTSVGRLFMEMATRRLPDLGPPLCARIVRDPALLPLAAQTAFYPLLVRGEGAGHGAELLSIMVEPAWRGQGVGALLLQALLGECARRGVTRLDVTVDADNAGARRFYARHGFVQRKAMRLNARPMCVYVLERATASHV